MTKTLLTLISLFVTVASGLLWDYKSCERTRDCKWYIGERCEKQIWHNPNNQQIVGICIFFWESQLPADPAPVSKPVQGLVSEKL